MITRFIFILILFLITHCTTIRKYHKPIPNVFLNLAETYQRKPYIKETSIVENVKLNLYAEEFSQGKAVYIEIISMKEHLKRTKNIKFQYSDKEIPLYFTGWGYRGFWGIHPLTVPGKKSIQLSYTYDQRHVIYENHIKVEKEKFKVFRKYINIKKKPAIPKEEIMKRNRFKRISYLRKQEAFKSQEEVLLDNRLAYPRDEHYITSPFWVKRIKHRYKIKKKKRIYYKPRVNYHRGVDLRGYFGTPIYAAASGTVVLAEKLFFEGNFTLIDHGDQVFSGYIHQSKILVEEGDEIKAGEKIGYVGSTGRSTGPHLHFFFRIHGVYVDPLSFLALPIRD